MDIDKSLKGNKSGIIEAKSGETQEEIVVYLFSSLFHK